MSNPKSIGMVHLKGINDKEYEAYIANQAPIEKPQFIPLFNQW